MLTYNSGNRPGNTVVTGHSNGRDHCIRAIDVIVVVTENGMEYSCTGGDVYRSYAGLQSHPVTKILLGYQTSKINIGKDILLDPLKVGEEMLVRDLVEWLLMSGVLGADALC